MVVLDPIIDGLAPLTLRFPHGPIKNNVASAVDFWQRRGGTTTIDTYQLGTYESVFPMPVTLDPPASYDSNLFGVSLRGRPLPGMLNVKIDTDDAYRSNERVHRYLRRPPGSDVFLEFDGVLQGGAYVNHSTLVWYLQDRIIGLL